MSLETLLEAAQYLEQQELLRQKNGVITNNTAGKCLYFLLFLFWFNIHPTKLKLTLQTSYC